MNGKTPEEINREAELAKRKARRAEMVQILAAHAYLMDPRNDIEGWEYDCMVRRAALLLDSLDDYERGEIS